MLGAAAVLAAIGLRGRRPERRPVPRLIAQVAGGPAGRRGRAGGVARPSVAAVVGRAGARRPGRRVVHQCRQFHGRRRLDDGGRSRADRGRARPARRVGSRAGCTASSWRWRWAVRCWALRPSIGRSRGSFSAMPAACRSAFCSAGCCCCWPAAVISRRRCCCRSIISPTRPSLCAQRWRRGETLCASPPRPFLSARHARRGFSVGEIVARVFCRQCSA